MVLSGKVAVVTGSSRGIGRAIAERLGGDGAKIVVTYHGSKEKADSVVQNISDKGGEAIAVMLDVRDLSSIQTVWARTLERFGAVDIWVNNAAGINVFAPTASLTEADYNSMFDITRGVHFALQMAAQKIADNGRIVSISTGGTSMAMAGAGAYAGSKAAVEQFSNALAKEIGHRGVTVNTLAPGVTDTDGMVLNDAQKNGLISQTPLGRLGKPDDIASAVSLLVSLDAHWITGQNIRATGGII